MSENPGLIIMTTADKEPSERPVQVLINEAPNHPPLTDLPEPQVSGGTVIEIQTPATKSQSWAEVFGRGMKDKGPGDE